MRRPLRISLVLLAACGASPKTPPAPASSSSSIDARDAGDEAAAEPDGGGAPEAAIPKTCASSEGLCVPDAAFVKRMCNGSFPDVALVLFAKDAPFTRVYLRGDLDGWNAEGGASARARLVLDEEVLVLRRRAAPANGIVVGAGGGYLVMRWDGNCYTVDEGEVTAKKPPAPKHASIPWRFYGDKTKDALLQSPKVLAAYQRRGKECKGATSGEVSRACEQADAALSAAVVAEIRGGRSVPAPDKLP